MSNPFTRREFLGSTAAAAAATLLGCTSERALVRSAPARRPNVLVVLADDLGYSDLGFQGGTDIPTPHLDALAAGGVRFTNGYVSCPVCSPTRAGFLTGRYQQRFGHEFNPGAATMYNNQPVGLPLTQTTFPTLMSQAGYKTGLVGKWHLGAGPEYLPTRRGFDEFFGFLGGGHAYQNLELGYLRAIFRGTEEVQEKEYLTDALSREASDFISRHRAEPFFLYLAYNAVHTPMQPPPRFADRFPDIKTVQRRRYAGMLSAMDEGVGRVLTTLRDCGLENDTLVFFFADNGGPTPNNGSNNLPLRGTKATTWEGGVRVPFVVRWPGQLSAGRYQQLVISLDILPTALAAAGGRLPAGHQIDGVDLMPYLNGTMSGPVPHNQLCWRFGPQHAIRSFNLKWTVARDGQGLFDLSSDIGESHDLSQARPDDLRRLQEAYASWNAQLMDALWPPQGGQTRPRRARTSS